MIPTLAHGFFVEEPEWQLAIVIVMIDPGRQPIGKPVEKALNDIDERRAHTVGGEGDVEHHDAAEQAAGIGQLPRRHEK